MSRPCLVSNARKELSIPGQFCSHRKAFRTDLNQQAQPQKLGLYLVYLLKRKELLNRWIAEAQIFVRA